MRIAKFAAFVVFAAILGVAGWAAYHASWQGAPAKTDSSPRPPIAPAKALDEPVAEYRETKSGPAGETGSVLTIDRTGRATLQTLPLGPGSKTMRTHLSCAELVDLPLALKQEFPAFRPSYGQSGTAKAGEVSIVSRWEGSEWRVVWHNPPSPPRPPEGSWAHVVVYFEDIRRRAKEEPPHPTASAIIDVDDVVVEYGHSSSGVVGTYITLLTIRKSGRLMLGKGLRLPWPGAGDTQLTPEELATVVLAFQEAKFMDFQQCYGQHAPVNEQSSWMTYWRDGHGKAVLWMSPPADPKPPEGWFRIVELLDPILARAREQRPRKPNAPPHN